MGLSVNLGENFVHEVNPPADKWIALTLHFEAAANETTVAFTETGDGDTYGTFIDAVEVREVTVDTERMPKPEKGRKKMRGKKRHSFSGGRRHKDCQSMRHNP
ncbi:MAG: hypothetical protein OHK0011_15590 [Turneriella sp.]